ncbi:MAG: hypothetical protein V7646_7891, partial [Pseudonocardia sp.]
ALNKAVHVIANTRMRTDPNTQAYVTRRRAEGRPSLPTWVEAPAP